MAQRLTETVVAPRYPWELWGDGSWWRAQRGRDFRCAARNFRVAIYRYAARSGKRAETRVESDDSVAFRLTPQPPATSTAKEVTT